ncbi:MAG: hypothetical protein JWP76_5455 [Dactylosporangium sp.]|jgi:hypothetical protein|nr:hypothetical protein [Dactylosporangium sp.]
MSFTSALGVVALCMLPMLRAAHRERVRAADAPSTADPVCAPTAGAAADPSGPAAVTVA